MRRGRIIFGTAIALAVIGLLSTFIDSNGINWLRLLPPLLVIGGVWLLYKYPPGRYKKHKSPKVKPSARTMAKVASQKRSPSEKRKHYPFQVIEGQKGKDDERPKYH